MGKITEKVAALPVGQNFVSLEFFPPKTDMGYHNLQDRIARMSAALNPLFVNVTWGAGGSTVDRSLELAELCQVQAGLTTCLHLTCTNMQQELLDRALRTAKQIGIRNILALRGDPPRQHEYDSEVAHDESSVPLIWAVDLVRYIRAQHGDYFCIGVAGYPEGHSDESNPLEARPEDDMPHLLAKIKAGADFIMTQVFYDSAAYIKYEKLVRCWNGGAMRDVLIIPGLMPIQSASVLRRTAKLSHASIPDHILQSVLNVAGNDEEVRAVGIKLLVDLIHELQTSSNCRGFHFYTLNLERSVSHIVGEAKLGPQKTDRDSLVKDSELADVRSPQGGISSNRHLSASEDNALTEHSLSVPAIAKQDAPPLTSGQSKDHGREATWDDFPNGRFGDPRSPAYGEIDGYGPSLHVTPRAAREKWGCPATKEEIGKLFVRYLNADLDQLPWSEGHINLETTVIRNELIRLIEQRGWWTIASQPAVNASPSQHPLFGWGPSRGFVFQKAFVELLLPTVEWRERIRPFLDAPSNNTLVSWYSSSYSTTRHNNITQANDEASQLLFESSSNTKEANSVTWGVFPGKEIVSPTIIEGMSFKAWAEEAFAIWADWERCYPVNSPTRNLLAHCRKDYTLINVICHDFQHPDCLWKILMAA